MAQPRRKVTEAESAELVAAWRTSKRALPAWCASQGIDGRSFRYWAERLDRLDRLDCPASICVVEVTVAAPASVPVLRLVVEDVTIDVPDGFTTETLSRVLAVVRPC